MRKQNSEFLTAFTSEASRKIKNTDFFGFVELDKFACYVIADGIDDDVDAISAKLAVDTVVSAFMESPSMSKRAVRRYLRAANPQQNEAESVRNGAGHKLCKTALRAGGQHPVPALSRWLPADAEPGQFPEHGYGSGGKAGAG